MSQVLATVNVYMNGYPMTVPKGLTILQANNLTKSITNAGDIPTLCYSPFLHTVESEKKKINNYTTIAHEGVCRICLVSQELKTYFVEKNMKIPQPEESPKFTKFVPACCTNVSEGGSYWINTEAVSANVKAMLNMILSSHPLECPTCSSNKNCELQDLFERYNITAKNLPKAIRRKMLKNEINKVEYDDVADWYGSEIVKGNNSIFYDDDKCIKCGRCIRMCSQVQGINVLSMIKRGNESHIGIGCSDKPESYLNTVLDCISCAQCTYVCPVGALTVKDFTKDVFGHLQSLAIDHRKIMIAQTAPAVRVGISEEFGKEPGTYSAEKMVAGLKKMGFKYVFDTDFTADLTIMEEGSELIERVKKGGPFPMFTSCCPAWINLIEKHYPEFIPNLSSCRSPQGMLSSLIRHYWAAKMKIDPKDIVIVSIMPCGAKKDEIQRPQLKGETDYVLSTRELGKLYRMGNIDLDTIDPVNYDDPLGESTGAAVIFGATGGVMEAALRTAYEIITNKPLPKLEFEIVRGLEGTKKATVDIDGLKLKAAVCHTTGEAIKLLEKIKKKEEDFHFIEIMACRGGCVGGGGEPKKNLDEDILQRRLNATYTLDEKNTLRKSHENKSVLKLYADFLEKPLSHKSHHLLHTTYQNRKNLSSPSKLGKEVALNNSVVVGETKKEFKIDNEKIVNEIKKDLEKEKSMRIQKEESLKKIEKENQKLIDGIKKDLENEKMMRIQKEDSVKKIEKQMLELKAEMEIERKKLIELKNSLKNENNKGDAVVDKWFDDKKSNESENSTKKSEKVKFVEEATKIEKKVEKSDLKVKKESKKSH